MIVTLFLVLIHVNVADNFRWKDYPNYDCDLTISAFELQHELTLSECQNKCTEASNCKGIIWYQYKKQDVTDPSRCYLLDKICNLLYYNASPAVTSFWYQNITQQTQCIDYPTSWTDRYADNCDFYSKYSICKDIFNQSSGIIILNDYDRQLYLNAFQVCCTCIGSLFEYTPISSAVTYFMESVWKPSHNRYITDNMVCQTYNKDAHNADHFGIKWDINAFLGICNYFTNKAHSKFSTIYSVSTSLKEDLVSLDYQQLNNFDCVDDHLFIENNVTFYLCNEMDYANYPYIIDISSSNNYRVYLNGYFINISDFEDNVKNNQIILQNQCTVESLINNNTKSNIVAVFLCTLITQSPTQYPSIQPTVNPTQSPTIYPTLIPTWEPTFDPTSSPTLTPTFEPTLEPTQSPIYSEKTQQTAFLLTFFLGWFGAGRWYVGEMIGGSFQLVMIIFVCCASAIAFVFHEDRKRHECQIMTAMCGCVCCALFIWWIVDLIIIGKNELNAGEMPLEPW